MVRLRLRRTGTRNKPCYRIVATDKRSPRDGRFIEVIGFYDPRHQDERVDLERADYWIQNGAQPTETVGDIIKRARDGKSMTPPAKVIPEETPVVLTPAAPVVEEAPAAEEATAEAPVVEDAGAEAPAEAPAADEAKSEG